MSEKTNVMELYIAILHQIDHREPLTEKQDEYLCELINRGLIRYKGRKSKENLEPSEIDRENITGLTYSGRMELARLEREQREDSWWYKSKGCIWTAICFVVGSLVSAFIGYLFR